MKVAGRRYSSRPHLGRCFEAASQPSLMVSTGSSHVQRRQDAHRPLPSRFTRPRGAGDVMGGVYPKRRLRGSRFSATTAPPTRSPAERRSRTKPSIAHPSKRGQPTLWNAGKSKIKLGSSPRSNWCLRGPRLARDTPGGMRRLGTPGGYAALLSKLNKRSTAALNKLRLGLISP